MEYIDSIRNIIRMHVNADTKKQLIRLVADNGLVIEDDETIEVLGDDHFMSTIGNITYEFIIQDEERVLDGEYIDGAYIAKYNQGVLQYATESLGRSYFDNVQHINSEYCVCSSCSDSTLHRWMNAFAEKPTNPETPTNPKTPAKPETLKTPTKPCADEDNWSSTTSSDVEEESTEESIEDEPDLELDLEEDPEDLDSETFETEYEAWPVIENKQNEQEESNDENVCCGCDGCHEYEAPKLTEDNLPTAAHMRNLMLEQFKTRVSDHLKRDLRRGWTRFNSDLHEVCSSWLADFCDQGDYELDCINGYFKLSW
jgi:hypothetical protein